MGMIIFLVCISLFFIGLDYFPFTTKSTDTDKKKQIQKLKLQTAKTLINQRIQIKKQIQKLFRMN